MTYEQTLDFLFNRLQSFHNQGATAYKPGLEKAYRLAESFGNPHLRFPTIHVGGTNGKGSTAHSLASVLMSAGLKVGLYTSPHLVDYSERIRIDGKPIEHDYVTEFVSRFKKMELENTDPSFFELTTILAFDYFAAKNVDIAVIEVGLGGRLDTTNIIRPVLSIITNIAFDHTSLLGNTITEIAREKAGIIKPGVPVVIGRRNRESDPVFLSKTDDIVFAEDSRMFTSYQKEKEYILYNNTPWGDIYSCLTGDCQPENMATILNALRILSDRNIIKLSSDAVQKGLKDVIKQTGLMGRWMTIPHENPNIEIIADTAHNPDGWSAIVGRLKDTTDKSLHIVLGFVSDKDYGRLLSQLPKHATFYFVAPKIERAEDVENVQRTAQSNGLKGNAYSSVSMGYKAALENAEKDKASLVFVGGSNFVVGELLQELFS